MKFGNSITNVAFLAPLLLFAAPGGCAGDEKVNPATEKRYESPKAVFTAYREARRDGDVRKIFSLWTPKVQDTAVFESFFACGERGGADTITGHTAEANEISQLFGKYIDGRTLEEDYYKEYKKKHGVDLKKFMTEHQHDKAPVTPPPQDDQLWQDAVAAHIKDKAGFVAAVAKHFKERDAKRHTEPPVLPLGDLEHLAVHGDTASGTAKETILPYVAGGESPLKPGETPPVYEKPFKFRRMDGGWLIDSP